MRRRFSFLLPLLCCFALTACSPGVQVLQQIACRSVLTHSPQELQPASDLVVVFTPESHENVLKRYSDGNVQFGYTRTTGRVEEVLSGEASAGDTIVITEECYISGSVL